MTSLDAARNLLRRGFAVVAVEPRGKKPIGTGWQDLRLKDADLPRHFTNGQNAGILLGEPSGWRTDVDLDDRGARAAADLLLPPTGSAFGRDSSPASHRLYVAKDSKTVKFRDPRKRDDEERATLVEIRSTGAQTVGPGSTHTSGEAVRWELDGEPATIEADDLRQHVATLAACALVARYWPKGARWEAALALAGALLRAGWSDERAELFLRAVAVAADDEEIGDRLDAVGYTRERLARDESATGWPKLAELVGADVVRLVRAWLDLAADDRPEITVGPGIAAMTDRAEAVLVARPDLGVFRRGTVIVRMLRDRTEDLKFLTRPAGSPTIALASVPWVREQLDRASQWIAVKDTKNGEKRSRVMPPSVVAQTLADRGEWIFPLLESVTETPVLLPDGSVLTTPGYDAGSGILYAPSADYPEIPDRPDLADVERALETLTDPLGDFTWIGDADRSVLLAAVLTVLGRSAFRGPAPCFAFRSHAPGSGKSLAADFVALVGTGREAARMVPPRDDEEARKRILALAVGGVSLVLLDNVTGAFGSRSFAAALTAQTVSDRVLGFSQIVTAPLRATWLLTGNNVTFRGDLGRRVIPCDLDPGVEFPEDRTDFRYPRLLDHVRAVRPALVSAALTVLRAFHVAGRPSHGKPPKGSFEAWDDLVRAALIWAGEPDPCATVERVRGEDDTDRERIGTGLAELHRRFPLTDFTVAEVVEAIRGERPDEELRDALAILADCDAVKLDGRKLGNTFRDVAGRIVDGLTLRRAGKDRHDKAAHWEVVKP